MQNMCVFAYNSNMGAYRFRRG